MKRCVVCGRETYHKFEEYTVCAACDVDGSLDYYIKQSIAAQQKRAADLLKAGESSQPERSTMSENQELQDCPYCPNQGFTVECERQPIYDGDEAGYPILVAWHESFVQVQCEFCWTNPLSKFNATNTACTGLAGTASAENDIQKPASQ